MQSNLEIDDSLAGLIDKYCCEIPVCFFERYPTNDASTVRTMNFALKCIVEQLRCPIKTETEAVTNWLIYKHTGPQRHQKFFGYFRQLNRELKRYNDITLVKKLNLVLKKTEVSGDSMYKLEASAIKYIGCAYLRRIYLLEKIRNSCVMCADKALGLLELGHWTNLGIVVVALCSQIHLEALKQIAEMEKAYKTASTVFRNVDNKFPEHLADLEVVQKIKSEPGKFDIRKTKYSTVPYISRLLKFSSKKIVEAQAENDFRTKTSVIISKILKDESSMKIETSQQSEITTQLDVFDIGISLPREDAGPLKSSCYSSLTTVLKSDDEEDDNVFTSPVLFGSKVVKKEIHLNNKESFAPAVAKNHKPKKDLKKSSTPSTLTLLSSSKKKKQKKHRII
ncbi:hypothetical protein CAEBREN_05048 [Caenorhabditis brenneri]|uniref:Nucleolus and neural progenitor protein-like N-terminal domain-containing protein n=1 Tax=Caenorhabditis brenneri TaxID=135651 RepID=G0N4L4_CAEBE|nr:hypothetical protein CAEBREN_05048 [Caenorhabditis brenneri]